MISVAEAERIVLDHAEVAQSETISIGDAIGRVLREPICTDRDQPPFDRVAMDGYAFAFDAWAGGLRSFAVAAIQKAGAPAATLDDPGQCIEIMTGAVLPQGCDCVVRYEDTTIENRTMRISASVTIVRHQNVHRQGSDFHTNDQLLTPGHILAPPDIAILAAVGKATVMVNRQPAITVISTGDELVDLDSSLKPYQIRPSNSYGIVAALRALGLGSVKTVHCRDDKEDLSRSLDLALEQSRVLIITGGVSMGKYDFVPEVLDERGIAVHFHKVRQRPGKPFWFGSGRDGTVVFALPGNPVSAIVCFYRYVKPWLHRHTGMTMIPAEVAVLAAGITFRKAFTRFMPARLRCSAQGQITAETVETGGSGNFGAMAHCQGCIELSETIDDFPAGAIVPVHRWSCLAAST